MTLTLIKGGKETPPPDNGKFTLKKMFHFYVRDRVRPVSGHRAAVRAGYMVKKILGVFGDDFDPLAFKKAHFREYAEKRTTEDGVKPATVRKELGMLQAAYNHNNDEENLPGRLRIKMPPKSQPRRRVWTEEEAARLMEEPMPRRIFLFFLVAFGTGARSEAIEELTWDRVFFDLGIIDFNVPGARITNKRRARAPMNKAFMADLRVVYDDPERDRTDPFVIGAGASTYHACAKVVKAAGLKESGVCRHICRKCYVSWRLRKGKPLSKIAMLIADRAATAEANYGFLDPEHLRDVADYEDAAE